MASSIIKIFRSRKHKDCTDGASDLCRKESTRRSLRCCSPIPSWRCDKDAIYISGASWTRPSAPYSVVTAPKKGKQTRSCPGGVSIFPSKSSSTTTKKHDSISSKIERLMAADVRSVDAEIKTSEYGSADPSPTESSQNATTPFSDSNANNSEHIAEIQKYELELRKLRKRLKEERQYFKGQLIAAEKEKDHMRRYLDKASRTVAHMQRGIDHERRKTLNLRRQLHEADMIIIGLQNQLKNTQYREVERSGNVCCPSCGSTIIGAGEALCALTHSNANLYEDPFISSVSDAPDEVKSFRVKRRGTLAVSAAVVSSPRASTPEIYALPEQVTGSGKLCLKSPRSPMKRSYSDSELPSMIAATEMENNSQECLVQLTHLPTRGELLSESLDGTSFSSDEDTTAIELLERQLKRRGDNVRFVPPRRAVRQATFRRFGRNEQNALAEFDYLQDLSTDASGIVTSSDYSSPEGRLFRNSGRKTPESRMICKLKV